jgi:hypothetical protein
MINYIIAYKRDSKKEIRHICTIKTNNRDSFFMDELQYDDVLVFLDYVNDFLLYRLDISEHYDEFVVDMIDKSKI